MDPILHRTVAGCLIAVWPVVNEKLKIRIAGNNAGYLIESLKEWLLVQDGLYKMAVKFDRSQTIALVLISKPKEKNNVTR